MKKRAVPIKSVLNFRDAGGYGTEDGRKVRWGKLFRSGELSALTKEDTTIIQSLGIKYIFDYRTQYEYDNYPDVAIPGVTHKLLPALNVDPANDPLFSKEKLLELRDLRFMEGENNPLFKHYKAPDFYSNNIAYQSLMDLVKSDDDSAFIQHCTAGKDRTGLGIAMVLRTLGVPRETVIEDYMLTNQFRQAYTDEVMEEVTPLLANPESAEVYKALIEVREEYITTLLAGMENLYGDFDTYLEREYGIDDYMRDKIKEKYLEG